MNQVKKTKMKQIDLFGNCQIQNKIVPAMPYMGNKRKLATKILNAIYNKVGDFENFYDLFGGGASMSVCGLLAGHNVYYNELNTGVVELLKYIQAGGKLPDKWVTRDEFMQFKNGDDWYSGFIKCCWSFGNNQSSYLFGKNIEEQKMLLHNVVIYKCEKSLNEINKMLKINIPKKIFEIENKTQRRLFLRNYIIKINKNYCGEKQLQQLKHLEQLQRLQQLQQLQQLEQLQRLERLEQLERLEISNKFYDEILIKNNSVIYCDIPYKNTTNYQKNNFNYEKFYSWALKNKNAVFISEYSMPPEFLEIASFKHRSTLSATANNEVIEKVFWNKKQVFK